MSVALCKPRLGDKAGSEGANDALNKIFGCFGSGMMLEPCLLVVSAGFIMSETRVVRPFHIMKLEGWSQKNETFDL